MENDIIALGTTDTPSTQLYQHDSDVQNTNKKSKSTNDANRISGRDVARVKRTEKRLRKEENVLEHAADVEASRLAKYNRNTAHKKSKNGDEQKKVGKVDKKLQSKLKRADKEAKEAAIAAARAEILLGDNAGTLEAEGDMERTFKFTQKEIRENVDSIAARNVFRLSLPTYGPYVHNFSKNGRHMILSGNKGHVAMIDCLRNTVISEFHTQETTRDVCFLHNHTMFAVAQKKYAYIYDRGGTEIHVLKKHIEPMAMEFLPYHFLLATIGRAGYLKYQDVSTGELIAEHRTKLGVCSTLRQNPSNAVLHCGHQNGCVTMWTPNLNHSAAKLIAHRGPVTALSIDLQGTYMATAGMDNQVRIWDVRMLKELHSYFTPVPPRSVDISQRGLLAVASGRETLIWENALKTKARSPYMKHPTPGNLCERVRFRPYEDVLGISHSGGYDSCLIPGAGEPNYDTFAADPFETRKQIIETEVHSLLDKLPASMIALDASAVGTIDQASAEIKQKEKEDQKAKFEASKPAPREKKKTRGRSKARRREAKKQFNVMTEVKMKRREQLEKDSKRKEIQGNDTKSNEEEEEVPRSALQRFL